MVLQVEDDDDRLPIRFVAPGRHSTRVESHEPFADGNYKYERTGAATATLELSFDADNNTQTYFEFELTFESRTAGTFLATVFDEDGTVDEEDIPGSFEIVDATVPALPGVAAILLAVLLLLASRLRQPGKGGM